MPKIIKLFLRLALSAGFLSAVADRFGLYSQQVSVWGNMDAFLKYTHTMLPWLPEMLATFAGWSATILEILFGFCLFLGIKTKFFATLSGVLLLLFGLAMVFSFGLKAPLDYSVFAASAAAFALSTFKIKFLELDQVV